MPEEETQMKLTVDFHTHTQYSDGDNTVAQNVAKAKERGLKAVALTEHGFSHVWFGIRRKNMPEYIAEARAAEACEGIPALIGIESNIRGITGLCDLKESDYPDFDVYLAGIHVVIHYDRLKDWKIGWGSYLRGEMKIKPSQSLIKYTTKAFINAIEKNPLDVVTHLNFQCFTDPVEVAKCCRDYGTYLEISAKKPHLTDEELDAVVQTGVRFVVNSDAHSIDRIGDCALAAEQIKRVGVPLDRIDNIDGKLPVFRFAQYKKEHGIYSRFS
ncbi:MAG: PHP domain-containing protein [Clostridia bacterium]|nr:PHP domain-containing protein [Clostridia bacterium]